MLVEIITIGDELLIGQIVDTNSTLDWSAVERDRIQGASDYYGV